MNRYITNLYESKQGKAKQNEANMLPIVNSTMDTPTNNANKSPKKRKTNESTNNTPKAINRFSDLLPKKISKKSTELIKSTINFEKFACDDQIKEVKNIPPQHTHTHT
jgi:hypothetical protein